MSYPFLLSVDEGLPTGVEVRLHCDIDTCCWSKVLGNQHMYLEISKRDIDRILSNHYDSDHSY